jgi:branched-chain amino acid transport system ATP-binding protein
MALLSVTNMTHYFGGLKAVNNYNLTVQSGQIRGLIGPNGAGKTTIFNLITGIYTPTEGEIFLEGCSIKGLAPYKIGSRGIARTFQNLRLWRHVTVLDHVKLARYSKLTYGLVGAFFGTAKRHQQEQYSEHQARKLLKIFGIDHCADSLVTNLPYGAQRKVEMARALAMEPKVLFLDEPTAGMNPEELIQMIHIIARVHEEFGLAIFLIEHRMKVVMELCQVIQVLVFGALIAEGTPIEMQNNPAVIDAYLGKGVVV